MRYGKDQKQATRQRILEAAGRRFKQDGIDGAGVAAVTGGPGPERLSACGCAEELRPR
jgi:TetR/AcrR family transcriptional repressor of nem operon